MANGKPYSELGEVMDEIARKRNVRGPYRVGNYVEMVMGESPVGSHWSQIFYGQRHPSTQVMHLFMNAFGVERESEEGVRLATAYLFRESLIPAAA